jgi:hypothetical protein
MKVSFRHRTMKRSSLTSVFRPLLRDRFSPDTPHPLRVRSNGYVRWLRQDWSVRSKASRNMGQPVS